MDNGAPIKEGYIVLKNEDTLRGFIKVLPITNSYPILDTGNNQLCDIDVKDISMMRLYDIATAGPYNDFFNQYILDKESSFLNAPLPGRFSPLQTAPHK